MDGNLQKKETGWIGYDSRQKGSIESAFDGLALAISNLENETLSIDYLKALHFACTKKIEKKPGKDLNVGKFREQGIDQCFGLAASTTTKEGILEMLELIEKEGKFYQPYTYDYRGIAFQYGLTNGERVYNKDSMEKYREKLSNAELASKFQDQLIENNEYKPCIFHAHVMDQALEEQIKKTLEKFNEEIRKVEDRQSKLLLIVKLIWDLEHQHPFVDANLRTFGILLLTRLLIQNGFPPATFEDPNIFDGFSKEQLVVEVEKAMKKTMQLINGLDNLFEFNSSAIPSIHQEKYNNFIKPFVQKIQDGLDAVEISVLSKAQSETFPSQEMTTSRFAFHETDSSDESRKSATRELNKNLSKTKK